MVRSAVTLVVKEIFGEGSFWPSDAWGVYHSAESVPQRRIEVDIFEDFLIAGLYVTTNGGWVEEDSVRFSFDDPGFVSWLEEAVVWANE